MASRCQRIEKTRGSIQWHEYAIDGQQAMGVTSVLGKAIDKPGLRYWYAEQGVLWALEQDQAELRQLDSRELSSRARRAPDDRRDHKAREGTTLHAYADALGTGQDIEPTSELAGRAQLIADFLDRWQVRVIASELTVWHERLGYAGTLDVIADLWVPGIGWQRWLLDYKTGAGVYPEVCLQLAAYRYATHCVWQGEDRPMPDVQRCGVVHVTAAGAALKPMTVGLEEHAIFNACQEVATWLKTPASELVHPALVNPTPEQTGAGL